MKDYKTLIADIRTEACELADKLKRLEVFMMSEDFLKLSPEQKGLLETQYDLMAKYKVTLVKRAHRINYEHSIQPTEDNPVLESGKTELACASCKWCGTYHENGELVYNCHNKDAKAIRDHKCYVPKEPEKKLKVPSAPPTFDTNPTLCETCIHPKGGYSTCHDCENGSNYSRRPHENKCGDCKWYGNHNRTLCIDAPSDRKNMPCFEECD